MAKEEKKEVKAEVKEDRHYLKQGEKVRLAKGSESPHYDRTEAVPGIQVGKSPKFV